MSKFLPTSNFEWLRKEEVKNLDFVNMKEDQQIGYIIECDLSYPEELHKLHNNFPLAPQSLTITSADLSPYSSSK